MPKTALKSSRGIREYKGFLFTVPFAVIEKG
jgi:hypothetical protein